LLEVALLQGAFTSSARVVTLPVAIASPCHTELFEPFKDDCHCLERHLRPPHHLISTDGLPLEGSEHRVLLGGEFRLPECRQSRRPPGSLEVERSQHIIGISDWLAPIGQQGVRPLGGRTAHGARDSHHEPSSLDRGLDRVQGATTAMALDDHDDLSDGGDDPIAKRETPGCSGRPER
jgi:hypothetical protein